MPPRPASRARSAHLRADRGQPVPQPVPRHPIHVRAERIVRRGLPAAGGAVLGAGVGRVRGDAGADERQGPERCRGVACRHTHTSVTGRIRPPLEGCKRAKPSQVRPCTSLKNRRERSFEAQTGTRQRHKLRASTPQHMMPGARTQPSEAAKECAAPPGEGSISVGSGAASGGSRLSGGSSGDGGIRLSRGRLRAGSSAP